MKIPIDKILKDLDKGSVQEKIEAFQKIKDAVSKSVQEEQEKLEQQASALQTTLDRINNIN